MEGFQAGSTTTTLSAAVRVSPSPPTWEVSRKMGMSLLLWKRFTRACMCRNGAQSHAGDALWGDCSGRFISYVLGCPGCTQHRIQSGIMAHLEASPLCQGLMRGTGICAEQALRTSLSWVLATEPSMRQKRHPSSLIAASKMFSLQSRMLGFSPPHTDSSHILLQPSALRCPAGDLTEYMQYWCASLSATPR